jgi:hypothetical protein
MLGGGIGPEKPVTGRHLPFNPPIPRQYTGQGPCRPKALHSTAGAGISY